MKRLWHAINYNENGSPLLDIPGAGPVAILIGVGALVWGFFL